MRQKSTTLCANVLTTTMITSTEEVSLGIDALALPKPSKKMTSSARFLEPLSHPSTSQPGCSKSAPPSPHNFYDDSTQPSPAVRRRAIRSTDQIPDLAAPKEPKPHINQKLKLHLIDFDAEIEKMKHESVASTRKMVFDIELANVEGIRALSMLEEQDEQLDRIQADLHTVNNNMTEVKRDISKMNRFLGCIPKKLFRCMPIKRCSRASTFDVEVYRKRSSSTLVVSHKKKQSHDASSDSFLPKLTLDAVEDEMDANMRQVSEGVDNLRYLSIDIHSQLMIQEPKLNMLVAMAEHSATAVSGANREVKQLIGEHS